MSKKEKKILRSFMMITQISITMLVPIFISGWLGTWLNRLFGTQIIFPFMLLLGIGAAFKNVYILTKSFYEADMKKEHEQLDYMKGLTEKRESMKQVKQVLKELMISSILWTAIVTLLFVIISRGRVSMLFGGLFGGAAALVLLWHMFRHLDIALDMDPAHASRHAQLASLQRLVIMAVTLAVCMIFYEYVHPIPAILTLFGVKVSALSYPKMHPRYEKLFKK